MTNHLQQKLVERSQAGTKRELKTNDRLVDFVSNDYLGLARSVELFEKIKAYDYSKIVNKNGSSGSRLLSGNSSAYEQLEKKLAEIFNAEAALLFNSGYNANLALVCSLPQKGDTILYDSLSHVCLKEGAWLSRADSLAFEHNDLNDLERKLQTSSGTKYIVIESVYSMNGDIAPLEEITRLAKKYEAKLIVDEAHSTGVFGENGSGLVCELGMEKDFEARIYTFGKGMGVHGACVCGSQLLIDYLINFGRPFVYTTALPIHSIFSIDATFDYLGENIHLQKTLKENIRFFNELYDEKIGRRDDILKPKSDTAIQPIIVPGSERVKLLASQLQNEGFDVRPIVAPTVKSGQERLRISIHVHNTREDIEGLVSSLSNSL